MSNRGKPESEKNKRNKRAVLLFMLFCVAVPGILYLADNSEDLLGQVRAILGF